MVLCLNGLTQPVRLITAVAADGKNGMSGPPGPEALSHVYGPPEPRKAIARKLWLLHHT